ATTLALDNDLDLAGSGEGGSHLVERLLEAKHESHAGNAEQDRDHRDHRTPRPAERLSRSERQRAADWHQRQPAVEAGAGIRPRGGGTGDYLRSRDSA